MGSSGRNTWNGLAEDCQAAIHLFYICPINTTEQLSCVRHQVLQMDTGRGKSNDISSLASWNWGRQAYKWFCHWLAKWPWASPLTSLSFTFFVCQMRMKSMYLVGSLWRWKEAIIIKQPRSMTSWQEALSKRGSTWHKVKGWYRVIRLLFPISHSALPDDILQCFPQKGDSDSCTEPFGWGGKRGRGYFYMHWLSFPLPRTFWGK